jgi:hypothetical protein
VGELAAVFRERPLAEWLDLFEGEDVMVGPVATLQEAAVQFGDHVSSEPPPALGEHTEQWRAALAPFEG